MIYKKFQSIITGFFNKEIFNDLVKRWNEPHRFYHNINHLNYLLIQFESMCVNGIIDINERNLLIVAAFFHDAVYDPRLNDNEEKSLELFIQSCTSIGVSSKDFMEQIAIIILDTKGRKVPSNRLSKIFWVSDNSVLGFDLSKLIEVENQIFKEFQWVDYAKYKAGRIDFLKSCIGIMGEDIDNNLVELIKYVNTRVIRIGLYTGSFNPFHIGHLKITEKSKLIFDKVIVGFGNNPDKEKREIIIPDALKHTECIEYSGLVTDLIDKIEGTGSNVTLIRGIRNAQDLDYETNQLAFINDIRPNTSVVYIPSDRQYDHVSSSSIKSLMKFDEEAAKKYLV